MSSDRELRQRVASATVLKGVVGAMRAIAGIRLRRVEESYRSLAAYTEHLEGALRRVLGQWPDALRAQQMRAEQGPRGVVVFGSEHGFAGAYNERVMDELRRGSPLPTWVHVIGARATRVARRRGITWTGTSPMITRIDGAPRAAIRLVETVLPAFETGTFTRLDLIFGRVVPGGRIEVVRETVLPAQTVAAAPHQTWPPRTHLDPVVLAVSIMEVLANARLLLGFAEALRTENALRLQAMERARRNVDEKLDELSSLERRQAQEGITNEILEVVSGSGENAHA